MTKEENRPAGCVLRLFGAPEQTVQKAVAALPDTWQGTVHCRTRGAETLVALQSSTPQQLHRAVQLLRTSLAPALYGEGEQTLAAAAVQALEQHRKLLVCSDAAAGALLETRLENLPGAEKVFDFGAMSYANTALTARLSRKLRKAPQAEPARTLARVQAMQRLTGAALAVGCVELPQSRLLLVGGKKGCWLRCVAPDENPGLWLLDMLRRAACGTARAAAPEASPAGQGTGGAFAAGTGRTGCGLVLYRRRPCRPAPKAAKPWCRKPAPRRGKADITKKCRKRSRSFPALLLFTGDLPASAAPYRCRLLCRGTGCCRQNALWGGAGRRCSPPWRCLRLRTYSRWALHG